MFLVMMMRMRQWAMGNGPETLMIHKSWLTQPEGLNYEEDNDWHNTGKLINTDRLLVPAAS